MNLQRSETLVVKQLLRSEIINVYIFHHTFSQNYSKIYLQPRVYLLKPWRLMSKVRIFPQSDTLAFAYDTLS